MILMVIPSGLAAGADAVEITDDNLKQALIDFGADTGGGEGDIPDGEISEDEMAALTGSLDLSAKSISDVNGLQYAVGLEGINLSDNTIRDISQLAGLSLTSLDVSSNYLDITEGSDDMAVIVSLQTAGCTVTYEPQKDIPAASVTITQSVELCTGDTFTPAVSVLPDDAANKNYTLTSGNEEIVTTSGTIITAVAAGSTKVTVTTQDGGYTAQCDVNVVPGVITSSKYSIYDDKLWFASQGTSAQELISEIYNDAKYLSVHKADGSVYTEESVATGMTLRLTVAGQTRHEVTILTRGDANGDGKVSITDYTLVRLHILGIKYLTGAYSMAADLNLNGTLTITDYTMSRLHILGITPISEAYTPIDPGASTDPMNPNDPGYLDTISNPKIRQFIEVALEQQGDPYVWGAEGPDSFDCSGFAYYCLTQVGYSPIYRTTALSYSDYYYHEGISGTKKWPWAFVAIADLQPGDLMFYKSDPFDTNRPIGHVGIYLGNGYHIHASSTYEQVIVSRLDGWYDEFCYYGRRINW